MHTIRELSNSYEMSKLAIDSMVDYAVYILDRKGIILSSNCGAKNLTGFQTSEVVGTHFARFYTMDDIHKKFPEFELKQAKKLGHFEIENWCVRKDGSTFWADIIINRLNDHSGRHIGFSKITKDLTSRKNKEDALKLAEVSAQRALKLKSQFIADISHEIRTPLGAMLGFAEFLQKEKTNEQDMHHYLDIILKNGRNLNRVINDVLDLSKIEAGRIDIEMNEFNLDNVIEETIDLFRPICTSKGIFLTYEKNNLLADNVISDANRLRQILNNLIGNAIKYTDKGEIKINVKKLIEAPENNIFRILIKDSGVGLSEDEVIKLFQPFVQIGGHHNNKNKGTGLGLVLSRRIAEALGGDVELISTSHGAGCVFGIKFTDYKTLRSSSRIKSPEKFIEMNSEEKLHSLKSKSILVVDDSIDNLEIIKLFLNSYGGEPDCVNDGKEALQKIQNKFYDVILMDIEMPDMNGFQLIKELKNRKSKIPVIALTAHAMPEDRIKTKNAGFFDHITKPIDFNYLVSKIETIH